LGSSKDSGKSLRPKSGMRERRLKREKRGENKILKKVRLGSTEEKSGDWSNEEVLQGVD